MPGPTTPPKTAPLQPKDLFADAVGVQDPFFTAPVETSRQGMFSKKDYNETPNASYYDNADDLSNIQATHQSASESLGHAAVQFGTNLVSSIGQGLANTFDLMATAKTVKGELTGKDDNFTSSLFGLSAQDMQNWANRVAQDYPIYEKNPDSFSPSDLGWWSKQLASTGTGVGMGVEALGETLAIEYATGGLGTAGAIAKIGETFKKLKNLRNGAEILESAIDATKGLKSAATTYGIINRLSESRMEGQNTYQQIVQELSGLKNDDGSPKYNENEIKQYASSGARRDFNYNLALLPLDILSYRTMVFNPISGSGEGLLERGLEKVAGLYGKSTAGKAAGWLTTHAIGSQFEGLEEGFQQFGQDEGDHYAKALAGMDDGKTWLQRLGQSATSDTFWNNYAGGVIGSPIIGGIMNLVDHTLHGKQQAMLAEASKDYIRNVGKMDDFFATSIRQLQADGKTAESAILRRKFASNKALSALHIDAMIDKDIAFNSRQAFLQGTLNELNNGKTDALSDLGFDTNNITPEQTNVIKSEFQQYIDDGEEMKNIYDTVKNKYNKNFVPEITQQHFELNKLQEQNNTVDEQLLKARANLFHYGQLSLKGRVVFDTEYKLRALQAEQSRLTNLARNPPDSWTQTHLEKLLSENKKKLTNINESLTSLNADTDYKEEDKDKDNEILEAASTLRDPSYLQAIYDKEQIENNISLQRKKIALWNNKEYKKERFNQSINNSSNRQQVKNNQQAAQENKEDGTVSQQVIDNKTNQLAADEVAKTTEAEENQTIGNSDLFADTLNHVDTIVRATATAAPPPAKVSFSDAEIGDKPEYLFSPQVYDFDKSSPEVKTQLKDAVKGILSKIGNNDTTSFEDLVRHVGQAKGMDTADKIFNALRYGWEANDKKPVDYEAVYNNIFGNSLDALVSVTSQLVLQSINQVDKEATIQLEDGITHSNPVETFDSNNQPQYNYNGKKVTNEASPKLSFISRLSNAIQETLEDGTISVSHQYTEDELGTGGYVDSLPLLDPDKYRGGTKMVIKIPTNFNDIKIPIFDALGNRLTPITFGQYVAQNNLSPDSQLYKDKIPMIIYDRDAKDTDKGLAFVHDIGWYNPANFNQEHPDDMKDAIKNTRDIRQQTLDNHSNNKPTNITITSKRETTFEGLKTKKREDGNYEEITLREANPQTKLALVLDSTEPNSVFVNKNTRFSNNNRKLTNVKDYRGIGQIVDIRRFGTDENNVPTHTAFPILRRNLDEEASGTVLRAINVYASRANKDAKTREQHDKVVQDIIKSMGIDIRTPVGIEEYLKHFINVSPIRGIKTSNTDDLTSIIAKAAASQLKAGTPYIQVEKGQIIFGKAGQSAFVTRDGKTMPAFFLNPNATINPAIALSNLAKKDMIGWYEQNLSLAGINANKPVVTIKSDYSTNIAAKTYNDYLLDRLKTNIKSYNIGTEENPNYVTNIQPVITYDTDENLQRISEASTTNAEVTNQLESENTEINKEKAEGNQTQADELIKAQEIAKKLLGDKFGSVQFSPALLNEAQKDEVDNSINRIAGLTSNQQFDITNFMFNQIVPLVDVNGGSITREDAIKQVDKAFDSFIKPQLDNITAEKNRLTELNNPQLSNLIDAYNFQIDKIKSVQDSLDILKEEAFNKVLKYTNIKATRTEKEEDTREQTEESNDKEEDIEDEGNERTRDFWTDTLTENPENRLTYTLRRFFGGIRKYDKNGNKVSGFLNLPSYTSSDVITRTLMVQLANIPADFNTMLSKLKSIKDSTPWMQEVIDKLENTDNEKKSQFVTVMTNTPLRMKFTMISYNKRNKTWSTKAWDTNLNGVSDAVNKLWQANSLDSDLIQTNSEGDYILNVERAKYLANQFNDWKGKGVQEFISDMSSYWDKYVSHVNGNQTIVFKPTGEVLEELKSKLVNPTDRVKFTGKGGKEFQISESKDGYKISYLKKIAPDADKVQEWLKEFGIILSPKASAEFESKGLYHNYKQRSYRDQFEEGQSNGLFGILANKLNSLIDKGGIIFDEEGDKLLDDTVIKSLATLEAKYNDILTPFGFRDNGKSYFALTAPKFITDRVRDLKDLNSNIREQLSQISFSSPSLWLNLLKDDKFKDKFDVFHAGANALKQLGKRLYRDNSLNKLSDLDHEIAKLGLFWDTTQGEVKYNVGDVEYSTYPDTNIKLRMGITFSPTMSDKHIMTMVKTALLDLQNKDLLEGKEIGAISDEVKKAVYEQCIKPELQRMIKFYQNGGKTNIKGYDEGAGMFLLLPEMNNIMLTPELRLVDAIKNQPNTFTLQRIEKNDDIRKAIYSNIESYVKKLTQEKLDSWTKNGIIGEVIDPQGKSTPYTKFIDKKYFDRLLGDEKSRQNMAATDFVVNSMVSNANSFMLIAGDPALYFKSDGNDFLTKAQDTYDNIGKRLANQIAPGTALSNSEKEQYIQIFLQDRKSVATNIEYLEKILGKEEAAEYRNIEASDAQEYHTWKEHLDILSKLGKTPDNISDITPEDISAARALFSSGKKKSELSSKEQALIGKVMQPIKPVYTGQIYDKTQDVMRTMYIKSSSFPLIPQLTEGMEVDKLRQKMEDIQDNKKMNVRASYQTANKVGALDIAKTDNLFDKTTGNIRPEILDKLEDNSLVLDRKNFRIQQEVPFKSSKNTSDKITLGTQIMKMLFGEEILNHDGFTYNGKSLTGKQLHSEYNSQFIKLVQEKQNQLFDELGLDNTGTPIDNRKSLQKLQNVLKTEAEKRGYPLQDIEGLQIDKETGQFHLPLWASNNSNRYESMLNSIITNRIIRLKMPGFSGVTGSEEGFRTVNEDGIDRASIDKNLVKDILTSGRYYYQEKEDGKSIKIDKSNVNEIYNKALKDTESLVTSKGIILGMPEPRVEIDGLEYFGIDDIEKGITDSRNNKKEQDAAKAKFEELTKGSKNTSLEKSQIIFTNVWNGKELQATYNKNGSIQKAQIFAPSKFRDNEGNLIDLLQQEDGKYKYVEKTPNGFKLKADMFDKDLLDLFTFRIPTSGLKSGSTVEIAGFLPYQNADLVIVPKNFTKQKGLDFDIDKENAYQYNHFVDKQGKFRLLSEEHRADYIAMYDDKLKAAMKDNSATGKMAQSWLEDSGLFGGYTQEDFDEDKKLKKANSSFNEKLLQNEIIKIHHSVYSNPSDEVQAKIAGTLNTKYVESEAKFIDKLANENKDNKLWTPLSDEYQKNKMMSGAAGKIGTGAYSLDVVFHSLAQQASLQGKPIVLSSIEKKTDEKLTVDNTGNLISNQIELQWKFGNVTSDGKLGGSRTLDGGRGISTVLGERQNMAVDNEKLQVMGRVGINDFTMDVDKVFNLLGFDKGEDGHSISFLFLSQPIIKDYSDSMKNANSTLAEYDPNKENTIINTLIKKYTDNTSLDKVFNIDESQIGDKMTNASFIQAIKDGGKDGQLQALVLRRFIEMKKYGVAIRNIQTSINSDSKGLGKSFFDVIEKRNNLNKLGSPSIIYDENGDIEGLITGSSALIGDYLLKSENTHRLEELIKDGYVDIGNYLVKPSTLSGAFNIQGVTTAYNLWSKYFPYDAGVTKRVFNEILPIVGNGDNMGDAKSVELKQEVFKGMKKYLNALKVNGIIQTTDDINDERSRLFIDNDINTSLARYIKTLKQMPNNPVVNEFIKTNKLLNRFEYDIQKNSIKPSLIKFNNAAGEEYDEQYLYESLSSMLTARDKNGNRIELPEVGNKKYTLDSLAQDLIAYCYLANSTQEAVQFTKYVPVSYLNTIGYSRIMRVAGQQLRTNPDLMGMSPIENPNEAHLVSEYTMQFVQHNPERVRTKRDEKQLFTDIETSNSRKLDNLNTFTLQKGLPTPTFISVYDNSVKDSKKFRLFWFDGTKYTRVPILGAFGMDEYQPRNGKGTSIINQNIKTQANPQAQINSNGDSSIEDPLKISSGNIKTVANEIVNANLGMVSLLVKAIIPYIDNNIKIQIATELNDRANFTGAYDKDSNTIYFNPDKSSNDSLTDKAITIAHELVHSLTTSKISEFIKTNVDGTVSVLSNSPSYVTDLVRLYNDVRSKADNQLIQKVLRARNGADKVISKDEYNKAYGFKDIYEFMAMSLSEPEFQKYLASEQFKQSGKTLLDKFKDIISNILSAIGVKFDADTATAQAIDSIFNVIQAPSKEDINSQLWDDSFNNDYGNNFNPDDLGDEPIANFSPNTFPDKKLDIKEENCL